MREIRRSHSYLVHRTGDDCVEPEVWVDTGSGPNNRLRVFHERNAWDHVQIVSSPSSKVKQFNDVGEVSQV